MAEEKTNINEEARKELRNKRLFWLLLSLTLLSVAYFIFEIVMIAQ